MDTTQYYNNQHLVDLYPRGDNHPSPDNHNIVNHHCLLSTPSTSSFFNHDIIIDQIMSKKKYSQSHNIC